MLTLARQQQRQNIRWLLCLSVLMLLALLLSLCAGEQWISPGDWSTPRGELFVWQIRLPRTLAVLLVGAALAISGAVMQALFENPLAEPGLLGVSNGAGVGLIAAVLLGQGQLPNWALGLCAIAGALIITLILLRFARRHLSTSRLLLAGVALGIICSALMTWAIYFSTSVDLRQLMYWMMGGFGGVDWRQSWLMLALIPVLLWICCQSRPMNMLALGEISARQLGLPLWFWRNVLVAATGWMVGVSVALAGAIGFIGLVIPTYSPAVWFNRSSRITSRLRAGRGERIAAGRYCSAPGISCRRAAYWRGHRNVGCAGVYLVIVKSRTLAAKRRSMIKS